MEFLQRIDQGFEKECRKLWAKKNHSNADQKAVRKEKVNAATSANQIATNVVMMQKWKKSGEHADCSRKD